MKEYKKEKEVKSKSILIEKMEEVMKGKKKVIVEKGKDVVNYMKMNELMKKKKRKGVKEKKKKKKNGGGNK